MNDIDMVNIIDERKRWKTVIAQLSVLSILLFLGVFYRQLVYVTFAFTVLTLLWGKEKDALYQLFFLLPFTVIYKISPTSSSFFAYSMLFFAIYVVVKSRLNIACLLPVALYLFFGLTGDPVKWMKLLSGWVLFYYFVKRSDSDDYVKVIVAFALGMIVSSAIGMYKYDFPQIAAFFKSNNAEYLDTGYTIRFSGLYYDPNYYSVSIIMSVFLIISLLSYQKIKYIYGVPLVLLLFFFGIQTYSKMYFFSMILLVVTKLPQIVKGAKTKILGITTVLILVGVGYYFVVNGDFIQNYLYRISNRDFSSGRFELVLMYLDYLFSNPFDLFVGVGLGGSLLNHRGSHNTIIEMFYYLGLLGTAIYLFSLRHVFFSRKQFASYDRDSVLLCIVFLLLICSLGLLGMNDWMFYWSLIWGAFNYGINWGKRAV